MLVARGGSLSPAEIATSTGGLAEPVFLIDAAEATADGGALYQVAAALAPTVVADFGDFGGCLAAVRQHRASVITTFVDRYCSLAAQLNRGYQDHGITWGHKDTQRKLLVQAGLSRIRAAQVHDERSLRDFVREVGLPVVVKPADGSGSRDLWLLERDHDIEDLLGAAGPTLEPGAGHTGMFAEEYIRGDFPRPHVGDYVSAEIFCFGSPALGRGFVTDRLVPM